MLPPREISPRLILASTSPFRKALLTKLGIAFATFASEIDESPLPGENPEQLVRRLAVAKARAAEEQFTEALIIGSDQVACIEGNILGKPGSRQRAIEQLQSASGRRVDFYTGLALLNVSTGRVQCVCEMFSVLFRPLSQAQIGRYLDAEKPYNCAGSFKSEGLGIALFEALHGDDPNTLIGLPLIRLIDMLRAEGVQIP